MRKEWRELWASRAWWVMFAITGPLVGVSFISAVRTYGELSGVGGTTGGVGEAFTPLIGIYAPTFSAYEIAALFLLPFVAIRLVAGDRQNGALKLELQQPLPPLALVAAKSVVLLAAWTLASVPAVLAALLWTSYGGHSYLPEILSIALGHMLNAGLAIALASAAASIAEHPSTAAILTLACTVGAWVISFIALVHGGVWDTIAGYTPSAMLSMFQHGLIRLDVVCIAATLIAMGLGVSAIWMRLGETPWQRTIESLALASCAGLVIVGCSFIRADWDTSENRQNSFSEADQETLEHITTPLKIEAHFAPEDGRRLDLERDALSKLRRVMPHLQVTYISRTSVGMFEQTAPNYGEIWYDLGGRREMSRMVTAEGVLETIYSLAKVTPPVEDEAPYRGYPLAATPKGAPLLFYGIWPLAIASAGFFFARRHR